MACERMQNLISDILAFSKINVTKDSLEYSDLNKLIEEVVSEMESLVQEKNATITFEKLPNLYVNPVLIKSLFENLISNSLKYSTQDKPPKISISAKMDIPPVSNENSVIKKYCRIYVQDNGIGFEQQYAEQIFSMFTRLQVSSAYPRYWYRSGHL